MLVQRGNLMHHADSGFQYVCIRDTEHSVGPSVELSVGSVGDSYDDRLAEMINGLSKADIIHRRGPCCSAEAVEFVALTLVAWFRNRRLLEFTGNIPPAESEGRYCDSARRAEAGRVAQTNGLRQILAEGLLDTYSHCAGGHSF